MRRLILSAVVFLLSFIAIQAAVSYLFPGPRTMMGGLQEQDIYNTVIAIALAAIVAVGAYSLQNKEAAPAGKRSIDIVKTALSDDEKALLDEVEKAGQITQDSLRFRLDWSKAKVSTIVSSLDRRGIVQRERSGKTYRVFLQKDFKA